MVRGQFDRNSHSTNVNLYKFTLLMLVIGTKIVKLLSDWGYSIIPSFIGGHEQFVDSGFAV